MKLKLKWGSKTIDNIDLDISNQDLFFHQLQSLTNVSIEKMKVAFKGKFIKTATFDKIIPLLKENDILTFIGTPDENQVQMPVAQTKFKEDLTDAERAEIFKETKDLSEQPAGMVNLGNTCQANSVFQFMKRSPEFADLVQSFNDNNPDKATRLASDIKATYAEMNAMVNNAVQPMRLMQTMLENIPQFQDLKTQQDAEECFNCLYNTLKRTSLAQGMANLFEYEISVTTSPVEDVEGATSEFRTEKEFEFKCYLENQKGELAMNIKQALDFTCNSEFEMGSIKYMKTTMLNSLPKYFITQIVRQDFERKGATKILRKISYSLTLDLHPYMTPYLKDQIKSGREKMLNGANIENNSVRLTSGDPTGEQDLVSVVTHQGRSMNKGHYICWNRVNTNMWVKLDDNNVEQASIEQVLDLDGGGDYHSAQLMMWQMKTI